MCCDWTGDNARGQGGFAGDRCVVIGQVTTPEDREVLKVTGVLCVTHRPQGRLDRAVWGTGVL